MLLQEHVNPCFHKSYIDYSISTVNKNEIITLNNNDHFALVSDGFWFKVQIIRDIGFERVKCLSNLISADGKDTLNIANSTIKRNIDDDVSPNKKQKTSESPLPNNVKNDFQTIERVKNEKHEICDQNDEKVILVSSSNSNLKTGIEAHDTDKLLNNLDTKVQIKLRRDRCWYGLECYRFV